ncbi:MAG: DUF1566 domain-containing protein [Gammaproteobacteria bacterium]|nr:DUF1566 domain-containing protein [Gammaproteobacteria bacterium]
MRSSTPRAFTGVQSGVYWSSTSVATAIAIASAWQVNLTSGSEGPSAKSLYNWVWPVRSDF